MSVQIHTADKINLASCPRRWTHLCWGSPLLPSKVWTENQIPSLHACFITRRVKLMAAFHSGWHGTITFYLASLPPQIASLLSYQLPLLTPPPPVPAHNTFYNCFLFYTVPPLPPDQAIPLYLPSEKPFWFNVSLRLKTYTTFQLTGMLSNMGWWIRVIGQLTINQLLLPASLAYVESWTLHYQYCA